MSGWILAYSDFRPELEALRETLCTLGNGYFATRGAAEEATADDIHYPGTYLAGCYDRLQSEVAGRQVENEDLVNVPNWLPLSFRSDAESWFTPAPDNLLEYRRELDLEQGVLTRRLRTKDPKGRITQVSSLRLVHMGLPHIAAIQMRITAENWSGRLQVRSALDGRVHNGGVARYRALRGDHLVPLAEPAAADANLALEMETRQSKVRLALAARTEIKTPTGPILTPQQRIQQPDYAADVFELELAAGESVVVEKVVALYSSRDRAISAPLLEAQAAVATANDFDSLRAEQALAWSLLWRRFDLELQDGPLQEDRLLLHLHLFHLLQVASPNVQHVDAGVPARGLHGEAYRGHVFWDELFILPTLTFRMPEISRALLMYRWYRLGAARAAARSIGCQGAMYPWQSGSNGREETQRLHLNPHSGRWLPDNSQRQRHVGLAVAYNICQYEQVTGNREFMAAYGAEMLLEIARFWASLAVFTPASGRYEIRGVMGPDEYHDGYPDAAPPAGIDNNAYTNVMASWVLQQASAVLAELPAERREALCARLKLTDEELAHWDLCSRKLRVDFIDDRIISQFQGYEQLLELDWAGYRQRYGDIQRLDRILEAEGDSTNRYKVSKQADVLMLFYLFSAEQLTSLMHHLGYSFGPSWIPDNVRYYLQRTSHGSSLSRVVHAWVLSRTHRPQSWALFQEALRTDYQETAASTTGEGIHLGAMAGTVDLLLRCYLGLEIRNGVLWLKPRLPAQVGRLAMSLHVRGRTLRLAVEEDCLTINLSGREPLPVGVRNQLYQAVPGEPLRLLIPRRRHKPNQLPQGL
jgi:alpha,alpha-trehalase